MKIIEKIEKFVACMSVAIMTSLVLLNVVMRFVFNHSLALPDEMSCYLFVLMSFMGTATAARSKAHLGLSIVTDRLKPGGRKWVQVFTYATSAFFCLLIVFFGIQMVISQIELKQQTAGMQWPEWIYGLFVPVGATFTMLAFLSVTIQMIRNKDEIVPAEEDVGSFWIETAGEKNEIQEKEEK